jgi:hypothetical protein
MNYELWGLHPASLIGTYASEAEALEEVRGLLDAGWVADDLSLGCVSGTADASADLFVAEGDALSTLLRAGGGGPVTRSA